VYESFLNQAATLLSLVSTRTPFSNFTPRITSARLAWRYCPCTRGDRGHQAGNCLRFGYAGRGCGLAILALGTPLIYIEPDFLKGVFSHDRSYPKGVGMMKHKRLLFSDRRLRKDMPLFPFKDSHGATIKDCRRRIPDRRIGKVRAE